MFYKLLFAMILNWLVSFFKQPTILGFFLALIAASIVGWNAEDARTSQEAYKITYWAIGTFIVVFLATIGIFYIFQKKE